MPRWSIALAPGWTIERRVDVDHEYVAIIPVTHDAILSFFAVDGMDAEHWIELTARLCRIRRRRVTPVRCGTFTGHRSCFVSGVEAIRGWELRHGRFPLSATFRCPLAHATRDAADLDAMLSSLRSP